MNISSLPIEKCRDLSTVDEVDKAQVLILGIPIYNKIRTQFIPPTTLMRIFSDRIEDNLRISNGFISRLRVFDLGDINSFTYNQLDIDISSLARWIKRQNGKKFIFIGGDHLITYPLVRDLKPQLLIVMDAHLDLKDTYMFDTFNNATVFRRIREIYKGPILYWGVRAYDEDEITYAEKDGEIYINTLEDLNQFEGYKAYLSIDVDVIDPHIMRQVTYPEHDGVDLKSVLETIKRMVETVDIHYIDIVEYNPVKVDISEINLMLSLAYHGVWYLTHNARSI